MLSEHFGSGRQQTCLAITSTVGLVTLTLFDCVTCAIYSLSLFLSDSGRVMILPIVSHTPAFDASDLPNVSPQLCEASSVVERAKKTGQNVHLLYNTTLTLASVSATTVTSVNARNN